MGTAESAERTERPPDRTEEDQKRLDRSAPSASDRVMFEQHEKPTVIRLGTVQFLVCLAALSFTLWFGLGIVQRVRR
jgi:hypothetical protein